MAKIYATYSSGCFCDKPALDATIETPLEPKFRFAKAARDLAVKLGAVNFQVNKGGSGRSAYAELPFKCRHNDIQQLRFDWSAY